MYNADIFSSFVNEEIMAISQRKPKPFQEVVLIQMHDVFELLFESKG